MIVKLVSGIIGLFCATALFWVGVAFEHRPHGWPNIHGPFGWTFSLPDGPEAKLDVLLAEEQLAAGKVKRVEAVQAEVSATTESHDVAAQVQIHTVYKTLVKEVPVYVNQSDIARCTVNLGFVRLFNAAASGTQLPAISNAAGSDNDSPSGVGLDTVANVTDGNDQTYYEVKQRLVDAQNWIREQGKTEK